MAESTSYARSTYAEIIDDIKFDIGDPAKIGGIPNSEWQRWIAYAMKDICERMTVREQKNLRLFQGVEDYKFADTTGIAGTGTITASGTSISGTGTEALDELVESSYITVGSEERRVVSVTDDATFEIESAFDNTVTAQAFTIRPRASEVPTECHRIYFCDRLEAGLRMQVLVRSIDWLLNLRKRDLNTNVYTNLKTPYAIAEYNFVGRRMLKVYPAPEADKTITLWTTVRINPRLHVPESVNSAILLDEMYEVAMRNHVIGTVYRNYIKDDKQELKFRTFYLDEIKTLQNNIPNDDRILIDYV